MTQAAVRKEPAIRNLVFLFLLSHLFILLNRSVGWDGYFLINGSHENLRDGFLAYGLFLFGDLHYALTRLFPDPVLTYNVAVVLVSLLSSILTYLILRKISFFTEREAFLIGALAIAAPYIYFNLIGITAVLFYAFFVLGLFCIVQYKTTQQVIYRVGALVLFFLSFFYHSHITYYLLALLLLWYYRPQASFWKFLKTHLDFLIIPVLFIVLQRTAFYLYSGYKVTEYNQVSLESLVNFPRALAVSFRDSFLRLFGIAADLLLDWIYLSVFILLSALLYVGIFRRASGLDAHENRVVPSGRKRAIFFLVLGFAVFVLGTVPFSLVFKPVVFYPNGATWMHQCNLYLGAALLLYGLVSLVFSGRLRALVISALVSVFVLTGFRSFLLHNKQWLKEESMMANFRRSELIQNNRSFLVDDNITELNSSFRIQFFTLTALMKRAFSDETRFAVTRDELQSWLAGSEPFDSTIFDPSRRQFAMANYVRQGFQYNVIVERGKEDLSDFKAVKLLWYSWFDKQRFNAELTDIVSLRIVPCTDCPDIAQAGNSKDKTSTGN